jgi:hypothetical protein
MKPPVAEALVYSVYRHRNFCGTDLFRDTLVTYLSQHFGLPQGLSQDLTSKVVNLSCKADLNTSSLAQSSDREFLKYLFVQVACADDDSELVEDLGLGGEILTRMKKSIEIVSAIQDAEADAPLLFLPDLDAQVCEIMSDITNDVESQPWALHQHRLLYQVMYVTGMWQIALRNHGVSRLFDILVNIGTTKLSTTTQISEALKKAYPEVSQSPDIPSILEDYSLAFPAGEKSKGKTRWSLTAFAMQLTQESVARAYLAGGRPWDIRSFACLSAEYQNAVIRLATFEDPAFFVDLIKNARPLAPKALTHILKRLVTMSQVALATELATDLLQHEPSPWLRKAACRSLATTLRSDTVDQVFAEVARSDMSASVRAEAQAALGQSAEDCDGLL